MSRESISKKRNAQSQQPAAEEQNQEGIGLDSPPLQLTASIPEDSGEKNGKFRSSASLSKDRHSIETFQLKDRNSSSLDMIHAHIPLQRQAVTEEEEEDIQLDSETESMLDEVVGESVTPPSFEVIAATTQAENSTGELTERITQLWRRKKMRVDDAARHIANSDPKRGDPHAMHSGEAVESDLVTKRWAIYLGAWNYKGSSSDLPDIRDHLQKGSPFRKALDGSYDKVIIVKNPTADQMNSGVMNAIIDFFPQLQQGNVGELTVYFEGHGGAEGITGVDWSNMSFEDMRSLGQLARDFDIHLTYILDTCNIGSLVNYAQGEQLGDLDEQISERTGPEQDMLEQNRKSIRDIGRATYGIGRGINLMYWWRKELKNPDERARIDSYFDILKTSATNLQTHLNSGAAWLTGEAIDHIESLMEPLQKQINAADGKRINRRILNRLRKKMNPLVDFLNDAIQDSLFSLRERMNKGKGSSSGNSSQ
ncbi:MAG: hypothetical protein AAF587_24540 [Bacteroidota bacterium]